MQLSFYVGRPTNMTFTDLEQAMIAKGIDPNALAINEVPRDCQYCIQCDGETTEVFRFERGIKGDLATFKDVSAAMEFYQALVYSDQSAYVHFDGHIR